MGLGPPVCKKCMKVMDFSKEFPHWKCSICNLTSKDKESTNLFCLTKEQVKSLDEKWGTDFCTDNWGKDK